MGVNKPDFSGWATKAGLKCSDGLTIMPNAFEHQDKAQVPLVWHHGHSNVENVLGHAILSARPEGVWADCYLNNSTQANHAKEVLEHGDVKFLSIWANQLIKRASQVFHGAIREVSLVLAGANPGATIETVTIQHADGMESTTLEDEAIITTGLEIEHAEDIEHADDGPTVEDVYDGMSEDQKKVCHLLIGMAVEDATAVAQSALQQDPVVEHGNATQGKEGTTVVNVFEQKGAKGEKKESVLSHDDLKAMMTTAKESKATLSSVINDYVLEHGITDIDTLFPEARTLDGNTPEWVKRNDSWVAPFMAAIRKSPFSRIKSITADLTFDEARAKGYIKGNLKKEQFFETARRVTTPTTIYKKQKLDRDDIIDITDFNVVSWIKSEMQFMIKEEAARACLIGDGRSVEDEDKISETNIRPILSDDELYVTTITVNVDDASSNMTEVVDAIILNRSKYKGTGLPNFYTTETWIGRFLTQRGGVDNRRLWRSLDELATELRVAAIIPVEVMEGEATDDVVGIIVNPSDYTVGADKGGELTMFDDFDIDYNQYKYLIETRMSGCLTKFKSAIVVRATASANVLVAPATIAAGPSFNTTTGVLTITNQTGVVYKNGATVVNAAGSPYAAIAAGASVTIKATPASGYYFGTSDDDTFIFTRDA